MFDAIMIIAIMVIVPWIFAKRDAKKGRRLNLQDVKSPPTDFVKRERLAMATRQSLVEQERLKTRIINNERRPR